MRVIMNYVTWLLAIALGILGISYVIDAVKFKYRPVLIKAAGFLFAMATIIALKIDVPYLAVGTTIAGVMLLYYFQSRYQPEWNRHRRSSTMPDKTDESPAQ